MKQIVMFSGGVASAVTAFRVVEKYGAENTVLLFCDTKMEDEDLYRFNKDIENKLGVLLTVLADGRTPWDVYFDERFLGNSQKDPCSRLLKRKLSLRWVKENASPDDSILYLGYYWDEMDRLISSRKRYSPYKVDSALHWRPELAESGARAFIVSQGIALPRLYKMGFAHNNCGGFCCKAGMGHFRNLLINMPERYKFHEEKEQEFRKKFDCDVSMMRQGGKNLTLKDFRERIELGLVDSFNLGGETGCGCFSGEDGEEPIDGIDRD